MVGTWRKRSGDNTTGLFKIELRMIDCDKCLDFKLHLEYIHIENSRLCD